MPVQSWSLISACRCSAEIAYVHSVGLIFREIAVPTLIPMTCDRLCSATTGPPDMPVQAIRLDELGLVLWPARGSMPAFKRYLSTSAGQPMTDLVLDIPPLSHAAKERLGYATQKAPGTPRAPHYSVQQRGRPDSGPVLWMRNDRFRGPRVPAPLVRNRHLPVCDRSARPPPPARGGLPHRRNSDGSGRRPQAGDRPSVRVRDLGGLPAPRLRPEHPAAGRRRDRWPRHVGYET